MQIWEPCMPVLGRFSASRTSSSFLPFSIVSSLSLSLLPSLFLASFLSSTLYSTMKTSKTSNELLVSDLMEKLDGDSSSTIPSRLFTPSYRASEAEDETR